MLTGSIYLGVTHVKMRGMVTFGRNVFLPVSLLLSIVEQNGRNLLFLIQFFLKTFHSSMIATSRYQISPIWMDLWYSVGNWTSVHSQMAQFDRNQFLLSFLDSARWEESNEIPHDGSISTPSPTSLWESNFSPLPIVQIGSKWISVAIFGLGSKRRFQWYIIC